MSWGKLLQALEHGLGHLELQDEVQQYASNAYDFWGALDQVACIARSLQVPCQGPLGLPVARAF